MRPHLSIGLRIVTDPPASALELDFNRLCKSHAREMGALSDGPECEVA